MPKVLVTDPIAQDGIDLLSREAEVDVHLKPAPDELRELIRDYDALVVRSETKVTSEVIEAGQKLQMIPRPRCCAPKPMPRLRVRSYAGAQPLARVSPARPSRQMRLE